jgi:hypothetical protein
MIKPYLEKMNRSEILLVMIGGWPIQPEVYWGHMFPF